MTCTGKEVSEIVQVCVLTMEGHQRAVMGQMTVEEIYKDRKTFASNVFDSASRDLYTMGVSVVSYTVRDVSDEVGYLASLGQARTATDLARFMTTFKKKYFGFNS